jgi:hypothetical protein
MVVLVEGDLLALRKQQLPMPWLKGSHDVPYSESRRAKPSPEDAALSELSLAFYREDQLSPSDRRTELSQIGGRSFLEGNHGGHEWLNVPCGHLQAVSTPNESARTGLWRGQCRDSYSIRGRRSSKGHHRLPIVV